MQGSALISADTPGGDGYSTYPLSLHDSELCDDHTPPSCLVTNSLAKMVYRSVNTLVLPDPWLTQGGPVTFPAYALHQLFVRSCEFAHHGLYCSHVYVCTHHNSLQHLHFRCLSLLSSRAHMDEPQCMRLLLGTTEWSHSYCTASSLSALPSLQQLQAGASSPPSGSHMVQRLQVLCPAYMLHKAPSCHRF